MGLENKQIWQGKFDIRSIPRSVESSAPFLKKTRQTLSVCDMTYLDTELQLYTDQSACSSTIFHRTQCSFSGGFLPRSKSNGKEMLPGEKMRTGDNTHATCPSLRRIYENDVTMNVLVCDILNENNFWSHFEVILKSLWESSWRSCHFWTCWRLHAETDRYNIIFVCILIFVVIIR